MTHDLKDETQEAHIGFMTKKYIQCSADDWPVIGISRRVYTMERRVVHTYGKLKNL